MTIVYYPKIRPTDYDLFHGVLRPDVPDSYDEGFDLATGTIFWYCSIRS
jgi:hypothetical protein